jgi:hypothetical protein
MLSSNLEGDNRLLTESQLAQRWQISAKKLQADRCSGRGVPFVRIGRRVRYRLADVEAYEAANLRTNTIQQEGR